MPDFGDDTGDVLTRAMARFGRRLFEDLSHKAAHKVSEHRKQKKAEKENNIVVSDGGDVPDSADNYITLPDRNTAWAFREYAKKNYGLDLYVTEGKDGWQVFYSDKNREAAGHCFAEYCEKNPEFTKAATIQSEKEHDHFKSLREKVALARENAKDFADFKERCKQQGIDIDYAADGELLYMNQGHEWVTYRGDTLGKPYTKRTFEREFGTRFEDLTERAVQEQEQSIQSHDGMDIDPHTRMVERAEHEKVQDKGSKRSEFFQKKEKQERTASEGLSKERGKDQSRDFDAPSFQDHGAR